MSNFNDINFDDLFRIMTPEEREEEKRKEIEQQKYYEGVKRNFFKFSKIPSWKRIRNT